MEKTNCQRERAKGEHVWSLLAPHTRSFYLKKRRLKPTHDLRSEKLSAKWKKMQAKSAHLRYMTRPIFQVTMLMSSASIVMTASVNQDRERDGFAVRYVINRHMICVQGLTRTMRSSYVNCASSLLWRVDPSAKKHLLQFYFHGFKQFFLIIWDQSITVNTQLIIFQKRIFPMFYLYILMYWTWNK